MARPRKKTIKYYVETNTENMRKLGIYKPEFDYMIKVFSQTQFQYDNAWKEFEKEGMKNLIPANGSLKRNPIVNTLEDLRKQLNVQSDKLGLTPKALDNIKNTQQEEQSGLSQMLNEVTLKLGK